MSIRQISLENFNPHKKRPPYITTPRSIEACKRQGIDPEELLVKTKKQFKQELGKKTHKAIVNMYVDNYEQRR